MKQTIEKSFEKLKGYVEREQYKGWDPYDGLESIFFKSIPIAGNKYAKLAWIQFFKKSPINFRTLFGVPKGYNSKGVALFLSGYCQLYRHSQSEETLERIEFLSNQLLQLANRNFSGLCWGYNFDWQARAFFQPKDMPTVVATTYCTSALLDAYDILHRQHLLDAAKSSCDFVLKDLNRTYDDNGDFCFSYSPNDQTQVFNASLLGSRLLSRVYHYVLDDELKINAEKSIRFCCSHQKNDGSWSYGTLPYHYWVDNFHTGFNLECLHEFQQMTGNTAFQKYIDKGFDYYLSNFFTEKGESKYYNDRLYPIDIHSPSQLVITLYKLGHLQRKRELVEKVLLFTINEMRDPSGYFYYQKKKYFSSKIPYMRWAQSWMFFALAVYLSNIEK